MNRRIKKASGERNFDTFVIDKSHCLLYSCPQGHELSFFLISFPWFSLPYLQLPFNLGPTSLGKTSLLIHPFHLNLGYLLFSILVLSMCLVLFDMNAVFSLHKMKNSLKTWLWSRRQALVYKLPLFL